MFEPTCPVHGGTCPRSYSVRRAGALTMGGVTCSPPVYTCAQCGAHDLRKVLRRISRRTLRQIIRVLWHA